MKVAVPTDLTPRLKSKDFTSQRIQAYDIDNAYPQRVLNIITASGTASSCSDLLRKHLRGRGIFEKAIEETVINHRGETIAQLHSLICDERSKFKGYALHIGYNLLFEIVSITHIPFEFVRLGLPDEMGVVTELAVHPDWANQKNRKKIDIQYYDAFTTDKDTILAQIAKCNEGFNGWKGQILYVSDEGIMCYPRAVCDAVLEDVETDAGIKIWKNRLLKTGFSATHIFVHRGKFENDKERQEFTDDINAHQGYDRSGKIMVVEAESEEQDPKMIKFESIAKDPMWEKTEETSRDNIIRKYEQPRTLHAIASPGQLGLSKEWDEAKTNYDERTEDERKKISGQLRSLMQFWHEGDPANGDEKKWVVVPLTGLPPVFIEKTLSETLLVGALTEVRAILESAFLDETQKVNILIAMYPIKKDVAESMVKKGANATA